jgi:hypothetical protein
MIKVTILTTGGRKSEMFAEHQTPREILDYFDVDYESATNSIDGVRLAIGDMDKSLKELGVGNECRLSSIVKIDNAAEVELNGAAAVLTSSVKLDDWKRVEKFAPDALKIVDEDSGDTLFKVMTSNGTGSANEYGVCFGSYTNAEGYATVTILLDEEVEDKLEALKEVIGQALLDLNEIEKEIPTLLKNISDKEAEIEKLIKVK